MLLLELFQFIHPIARVLIREKIASIISNPGYGDGGFHLFGVMKKNQILFPAGHSFCKQMRLVN